MKKLLGAQEEERRRVAYEVHDGLAQVAVAAHQNLQAFARRHAPESEKGRKELDLILRASPGDRLGCAQGHRKPEANRLSTTSGSRPPSPWRSNA